MNNNELSKRVAEMILDLLEQIVLLEVDDDYQDSMFSRIGEIRAVVGAME